MSDPTSPFGRKRGFSLTMLEERLIAIETLVQQVPSRQLDRALPIVSDPIAQTAHGFAVGDVVARNPSGGLWSKASSASAPDAIGIVDQVDSVNTFSVVLSGPYFAPGLRDDTSAALSDYTSYYLSTTPGKLRLGTTTPTAAPNTWREVLRSLKNGLVIVLGPDVDNHDHDLTDARDLDVTALALGCVPVYNPDQFGTGIGGWKASPAAAISALGPLTLFGNATNASAVGAAIGPAPANAVMVCNAGGTALTWGQVQTAGLADGSVTKLKLGTDVTLEALKDVSITVAPSDSRVLYDAVSWNGTAWVNRNIGPIVTAQATGGDWELGLDGGASGLAMTVGIGHAGSRLYLAAAGSTALDFKLSGSADTDSDVCARMKTWSGGVQFYDQATGLADGSSTGAHAGDKVIEWACDASPGNRHWDFYLEPRIYDQGGVAGGGGHYLRIVNSGTQRWDLTDDTGQNWLQLKHGSTISALVPTMTLGTVYFDLASNTMFMAGVGGSLASISGTSSSIVLSGSTISCSSGSSFTAYTATVNTLLTIGASASLAFASATPSITATTSFAITAGVALPATFTISSGSFAFTGSGTYAFDGASLFGFKFTGGGAGYKAGFFGATPVVQGTVNAAITQSTTTAPAAYAQSNSTGIIADVASCVSAINALRTLVRNLGFAA